MWEDFLCAGKARKTGKKSGNMRRLAIYLESKKDEKYKEMLEDFLCLGKVNKNIRKCGKTCYVLGK